MNKKFATAISCIDGRIQIPIIKYLKNSLSVDYIDMITEPGPNKILSENKDLDIIESLREKIKLSTRKHGSDTVIIVGHYDCAANTESKEIQIKQLLNSIDIVSSWRLDLKRVFALWLDKNFKPTIIN